MPAPGPARLLAAVSVYGVCGTLTAGIECIPSFATRWAMPTHSWRSHFSHRQKRLGGWRVVYSHKVKIMNICDAVVCGVLLACGPPYGYSTFSTLSVAEPAKPDAQGLI